MKAHRNDKEQSINILEDKDNEFIDYKFKALAYGGSFYIERKLCRIMYKEKINVTFKNELLIQSFEKAMKNHHPDTRLPIMRMVRSVVYFTELDNAYKCILHEALDNYYKELKKNGMIRDDIL
jgi:hypothetical protein